jgi:hypothetical protein
MCQGSQSLGNSRGLSRSWHQPEDKSQKAAVIVTGTYSEVRSLLDSYNNPGYTLHIGAEFLIDIYRN